MNEQFSERELDRIIEMAWEDRTPLSMASTPVFASMIPFEIERLVTGF